jgi:hypothetical protein
MNRMTKRQAASRPPSPYALRSPCALRVRALAPVLALRAMDQRVVTLEAVLRDVLDNRGCSCGGWKCARCKLALREARQALR